MPSIWILGNDVGFLGINPQFTWSAREDDWAMEARLSKYTLIRVGGAAVWAVANGRPPMKCAVAVRLITSVSTAASRLPIFFANLSMNSWTIGMCV